MGWWSNSGANTRSSTWTGCGCSSATAGVWSGRPTPSLFWWPAARPRPRKGCSGSARPCRKPWPGILKLSNSGGSGRIVPQKSKSNSTRVKLRCCCFLFWWAMTGSNQQATLNMSLLSFPRNDFYLLIHAGFSFLQETSVKAELQVYYPVAYSRHRDFDYLRLLTDPGTDWRKVYHRNFA